MGPTSKPQHSTFGPYSPRRAPIINLTVNHSGSTSDITALITESPPLILVSDHSGGDDDEVTVGWSGGRGDTWRWPPCLVWRVGEESELYAYLSSPEIPEFESNRNSRGPSLDSNPIYGASNFRFDQWQRRWSVGQRAKSKKNVISVKLKGNGQSRVCDAQAHTFLVLGSTVSCWAWMASVVLQCR